MYSGFLGRGRVTGRETLALRTLQIVSTVSHQNDFTTTTSRLKHIPSTLDCAVRGLRRRLSIILFSHSNRHAGFAGIKEVLLRQKHILLRTTSGLAASTRTLTHN